MSDEVIDAFHRRYYDGPSTWQQNRYCGLPINQCPLDLHTYQEVIYDHRPRFIVQTGVFGGGSILYFAHVLDAIGAPADALVIGVDLVLSPSARSISHPRVRLIEGSSTDPATIGKVRALLPADGGMVSLDSDHSEAHVLAELRLYQLFVAEGQHLVVEDTNVHGHPVLPEHGPGPMEATAAFLAEATDFTRVDHVWQRQLFSFHQYGWLRRVARP